MCPTYSTLGGVYYMDQCQPCSVNNDFANLDRNRGDCPASSSQQAQNCDTGKEGNPIKAGVANKYQRETDLALPGNSTLGFERHYNSRGAHFWYLGRNWRHTYDRQVTFHSVPGQPVTHARVWRPDGNASYFNLTNGVWSPVTADITETLQTTTDAAGSITSATYTMVDGTVETYGPVTSIGGISVALVLSIRDRAGLVQAFTHDAAGKLSTVTDPFGHTLTLGYDSSNRINTLTGPDGQVTRYEYGANKNLVKVIYPDNSAKLYHYENASFPNHLTGISFVEASGTASRYATYGYDASGWAISTEHAGGQERRVISYTPGVYFGTIASATVTDASGGQETLTFNTVLGVANVASRKNLTDGKTRYQTFDSRNNLACVQDEEGRVTTFTYNTTNQKTSETRGRTGTCAAPLSGPATRTTTYQYLSPTLDLPTQIQSPSVYAGSSKTIAISYSGNLPVSITQSGFTPSGAPVTRTVTMTYNAAGQVTSIDGSRTDVSDVTTLAYNNCATGGGCGQVQSVTNALGQTTTYDSYDTNGRLLQMTDPNGLKTVYTYDARGRVLSITQIPPAGNSRITSYTYSAAGDVASVSLPTGLAFTYTYDAARYLRRVTDSLGNYIDYGYDLKGNRTQTYTYHASGILVRTVDLAFDARNHVIQINAGGSITRQIVDAVGNLTRVTDPNTVATNGTTATNNNYDALNRLLQTVDRLNGSTNYSYDANDRLQTVQAPNGASTQYQYDDLGNLLSETSPDRGTVSYVYDAAGNVVRQTDARGVVANYAYDALNRVLTVRYGSGLASLFGTAEDVTYTYDNTTGCTHGLGRLCTVVDESGGTAHAYDAFGNRLVQTHAELGVTYNTFYAYDAGNRVTRITYPDGRAVTYQRDILGRITSVATTVNGTAVTLASGHNYRPDGLLLSQTFGNGLNDIRQYDIQGRLTYQSLASADTRLYSYDANGNLTGLQSLPLVGVYNYDALDRLSLDQRTTTGTTSSRFTYDANGNRLGENTGTYAYLANTNRLASTPSGFITLDAAGNTINDGTRSYTYNNAGQLSTVAGAGYAYNAERARSRKVVGSVGTVYHYDFSGNLIAESDTNGAVRRNYVWGDGQPLAQIEPVTVLPPDAIVDNNQASFTGTWATSTSIAGYYGANYQTNAKGTGKDKAVWSLNIPSTGTYQVYARWVAGSRNASNAPYTVAYSGGSQTVTVNQQASGGQWVLLGSFAFTAGPTGSVTLTDNANGTVIADAVKLVALTGDTTSEAIRYLHTDHLNTPRLATNAEAQAIWRWEGTAFGGTYPNEDPDGDGKLTTVNLRFPGQYYDAESGLHYNWNRYYDPKIGRYVTSDPVGLRGGLNTYAYANLNPMRWIDPMGLWGDTTETSWCRQNPVLCTQTGGGAVRPVPIPFDIPDGGSGGDAEACENKCRLAKEAGLASCVQLYGPKGISPNDGALISCVLGVHDVYAACIAGCRKNCK